jgi:hypothetical protein
MKTITGYSNYAVSQDGKTVINTKTGKTLKQGMHKAGYPQVSMVRDDGVTKYQRVHRLVVSAYMNIALTDLPAVNHIDGVRTNNDLSNLEACTIVENASIPRHTSKKRTLPKGIHTWNKGKKKYRVALKFYKKYITAYFNDIEEATAFYVSKFIELHGSHPYTTAAKYSVKGA